MFVRVALAAVLLFSGACNRGGSGDYLAQGKKFLAAKDYPRALLMFKKQARLRPQDPEPLYQLGLASIAAGDVQSGAAYLRKVVSLNPKHVGAHKTLAELMVGSVDKDILTEAKELVQAGLAIAPTDSDLLELLGFAEIRLGEEEAGERHLREALERFPQHLKAAMSLSSLELARGDRAAAERILLAAVSAAPQKAEPALALGRFYRMTGKTAEAEREYRRALQVDGSSTAAVVALAALLLDTGNSAGAEALYKGLSTGADPKVRHLYGSFLFEQQRHAEATAEFRRLFAQAPADRTARTRLVSALVTAQKRDEAAAVLTDALSKNRKDTDALLQLAEIHLLQNRPADAQPNLALVLRFKPDSAEAHYLLARVHRMRGEHLHCRQELAEAVKFSPGFLRARTELARLFIEEGKAKSALDLMNAGPEWHRRHPAGILELNWALFALGEVAELRRGVAAGLAHARTPGLLIQQAFVAMLDKQYSAARAAAEEALRQNPEELQALTVIVRSYLRQSDESRARAAVLQHAAAHPRSAPVQQFAGEWLRNTGAAADARRYFAAAADAAPSYLPARLALAGLDLNEGKADSARKLLLTVLERAPRSTIALTQIAQLEVIAGRRTDAVAYYRKLVEIDARNQSAVNNLAFLLLESNPDEALLHAQRAKELAPDNAAVDDTLGWAFYKKGLYSSAVRHLEAAAKSGDALHQYHLAAVYAKVGDRRRGEQILAAALKTNPNLPEAAMARRALEEMPR